MKKTLLTLMLTMAVLMTVSFSQMSERAYAAGCDGSEVCTDADDCSPACHCNNPRKQNSTGLCRDNEEN
jgi:hypothetical protein